jgi:hypothetical protein
VTRSGKVALDRVWKALDEAEFGARNTLNLRESLPTAADARFRAEAWLRERQVSKAGQVLMITGRGNNSPDGISAVRQSIVALLPLLRRRGVVEKWVEHSPGSFVVTLAPIGALLEAPRRKKDRTSPQAPTSPQSLEGLDASTLALLHHLATRSLEALGVRDTDKFVEGEMLSKFNSLAGALGPGVAAEERLRDAISIALDELDA